jgi:hypothetical protein
VYRSIALHELGEQQERVAEEARAQGGSAFYSPGAERAYLRQLADASIPHDHILHATSHKYLEVSPTAGTAFVAVVCWGRGGGHRLMIPRLAGVAEHREGAKKVDMQLTPRAVLGGASGPPLPPSYRRRSPPWCCGQCRARMHPKSAP